MKKIKTHPDSKEFHRFFFANADNYQIWRNYIATLKASLQNNSWQDEHTKLQREFVPVLPLDRPPSQFVQDLLEAIYDAGIDKDEMLFVHNIIYLKVILAFTAFKGNLSYKFEDPVPIMQLIDHTIKRISEIVSTPETDLEVIARWPYGT